MHYYKFNIKDWTRDTAHLSVIEEGLYRRLLDHYYESEKPIPKETGSVIRRLRLTGHEDVLDLILSEFFVLSDDGYRHKRCDDEFSRYHAKAEINQRNGKSGGRPKSENNPDGYQKEANGNLNHKPLTTNHKPLTTNQVVFAAPNNTYAVATVGKKSNKGTRLPTEWALPKEWGNWALDRGMSRDAVLLEAETFRNHWVAKTGKDACKADWEATWRNWIIRATKDRPKTYYELTKEAKERDADKRLTGIANADIETLEALGLARDGRILGS